MIRPAAIIMALAAVAHADPDLDEARRLQGQLAYDQALAIVERAIARGTADPKQLAALHELAGELTAGLDRAMDAEEHFSRLLAIDPDAALPAGTSPKITAPFYAARGNTARLVINAMIDASVVEVRVTGDNRGFVQGVAATVTDASGATQTVREPHGLRLELPAGAHVTSIAVLDEHGNRVWTDAAPVAKPAPPPPPPPAPRPAPLYARWSTWTIAGTAALAVGGVCAWRFSVAQTDWNDLSTAQPPHDYSELRAIEQRGDRWALAANISFGVAGAAAIGAVLALALHHDEPAITISATASTLGVAGQF